jgi:hypothetical protein
MARIAGAGGGGGSSSKGGGSSAGPRQPTQTPDSLNSTQYATLLDLISEGEIEGLKNGYQSVFIGNTPLQNPDGSYNFQEVWIDLRYGTQDQSYIPIAADVEDEKPVGVAVQYATPITKTITDTAVNAVRVTITVPQLQSASINGDTDGSQVGVQIFVQYNGGGYTEWIRDVMDGRTGDAYQRDYLINLSGPFPVDIRVARDRPDNTNVNHQNSFNWTSYTEIIYAKLRYPNSALVALRINAEQFSSIPSRSYLIRGIKVCIPSNATVDQSNGRLIYSGIWNGTFGAAQWCSDPVWILWNLLTSTRYGFGDHIQASQLDRWAFYAASQYASALVPDGFGGWEPRFSCNVNIQTAEEAYKLINDMCSVFRVMPYWATGALTISQDRPADPAYLFTLANVSGEGFSYQGSSRKTRPTVAVVSYMDLATRDIAYEVVEDQAAIAKYGVVTTQISAFACNSRGQAHRLGEWLLYSEHYESEVVSFTASIDAGVVVRPGQIIEISDPVRAGSRRGGRISAATASAITLDDATGLTAAGATLSVVLPDGTVQSRAVATINGNVVNLATPLSAAPNQNSIWIHQTSTLQTSTWRVLSVTEQDGAKYAISALAYNASKYAYIERGAALQPRDVTDLNVIPAAPINLQAVETLYEANGRALAKLIISWRPVVGVSEYRIRWRPQNGNWTTSTQARPDYEIFDTTAGLYEVQVYSVSAGLRQSVQPARLTVQAFGKTAPPASVTGVSLIPIDGASAILSWERSTELDVVLGGKVLIRHNVAMVGATWEESQEIVAAAAGGQTQKQVPLLDGTYLLKFEDDSGNRSAVANAVVVDLPTPQPRLLVQSYREDQESPPFSGNPIDMLYNAELDGLVISTGVAVDSMATDGNWDALGTIDGVGGVLPSGEYEFGSTLDLGGVFDLNMTRYFVTRPYLPGNLWDDKLGDIDDWPEIDDSNIDGVNAQLYVRTTEDDPAVAPSWSGWREFSNAITRGRGFQFKVVATSSDPAQNIIIDELGCQLELQQRTEQSATLTSGAATYTVTFIDSFYQAPSVGVTGYDMATGDYFTIAAVTRTGFQVTFRNSAGTAVNRQFAYTAIGYGREI